MRGGRGRRRIGGVPPADLLVCFHTRAAHLTLMPKPICSPSRPLFRTNKAPSKSQIGSDVTPNEPTSPEVTCAGQIKVRPKNGRAGAAAAGGAATIRSAPDSKNWLDPVGIKKDVMNLLGTLRSLRFNMGCFGAFNAPIICDEDEEEEEEAASGSSQCETILSKWFMALDESQGKGSDDVDDDDQEDELAEEEEEEKVEMPPPKNALLLMRCLSAPARRRGAVPDFLKVSTDVAKETWLVGSVEPMLARSRSWRR